MNKEIKKKWVAALRSGDYTQGKKALCRITPKGAEYCCLGVLAEVVEGEEAWEQGGHYSRTLAFRGNHAVLNPTFRDKVGIGPGTASKLMIMNDRGVPFSEIADFIEENP